MNFKAWIVSLFLCAFLGFATSTYAVEILAPAIQDMVTESGDGKYQQVMKESAKRAGVTYQEIFYPIKRALAVFEHEEKDCIYSYMDQAKEIAGPEKIITSYPITVFKLYMFTRKGTEPPTSPEQLVGKQVGGVMGHEGFYDRLKDLKIDYSMANDDNQNLKMLEMERVDVLLGFLPDLAEASADMAYAPDAYLYTGYDAINCRKNPETEIFIEKISRAIKEMKADGTLKSIMGSYYVEFEYP